MVHKGKKAFLKKQKKELSDSGAGNAQENKPSKKAKIIVRNLPFKNLSEKTFEELFKEYGEIEEVKLLKKDDGKYVGCGFVQFKKVNSAAKAIHFANLKEIHGRKIVVDWAIPKTTFLEKAQKLEEEMTNGQKIKTEILSDEDDEEEHKVNYSLDRKHDKWDSDDEKESDEEDEEQSDNENDESDDGSSEDDDKDDSKSNVSKNATMKTRPSDVEEGKTLFIRNVPFSVTNDDLKECFENYGPVEYALICIDKLTEHSKGTAFVKFKDKDSVSQCLKDSMNIYLHDNPLTVTMAVCKENLENKKNSKKVVKDSRNLYLIREGLVMAGSKAALGVSASDMAKRLQIEQWKSQILKNLNMFVSKTRLVIHNLPPDYDDYKLKNLFLKFGNPKAIIKEAKVMRDKKKVDSQGNGLSKEVGFVSFANHEDALMALRNLNNNPEVFTVKSRPIVAFSIENKAVLNQKLKRIEKSRAKLGITMDPKDKLSKLNRKQRRFIRRRQKIIDKRREAKKLKQEQGGDVKAEVKDTSSKKRKSTQESEPRKKRKVSHSDTVSNEQPKAFAGELSNPGKKVKPRSRYKLKIQAHAHSQTLKKEKKRRKEKGKKKLGPMKQPKQKKGKPKLMDDAKLSKLLSKHRASIQESSVLKKWYDK